MTEMTAEELKKLVSAKIDQDKRFRKDMTKAVETGSWEYIVGIIAKAVGFTIKNAQGIIDWLKLIFG